MNKIQKLVDSIDEDFFISVSSRLCECDDCDDPVKYRFVIHSFVKKLDHDGFETLEEALEDYKKQGFKKK